MGVELKLSHIMIDRLIIIMWYELHAVLCEVKSGRRMNGLVWLNVWQIPTNPGYHQCTAANRDVGLLSLVRL